MRHAVFVLHVLSFRKLHISSTEKKLTLRYTSRVSNISRFFFFQQIITDFIEIEGSELGKISKILASTRLFYILSNYSIHSLFPRSIKEIMYLIG